MRSAHRLSGRDVSTLLAVGLLLVWPTSVWPQSIIATLPVAGSSMAVNAVTHKVYVANSSGSITVIDGATDSTTTLQVGGAPAAVAVNQVTNQIYIANAPSNSITVINGATNALTTVSDPNAKKPSLVAVNEATNKIYIVNSGSLNVTVIDGSSKSTTTVGLPEPLGSCTPDGSGICSASVAGVAINSVTNQIYVAHSHRDEICDAGVVSVIDGASNAVTNITVGPCPQGIAVNPVTNTLFVTLGIAAKVAVIDAATNVVTDVAYPNDNYSTTAVAANATTNKIYVISGVNVSVIDGATLSSTSVAIANPAALAVDATTNTVYVTNGAWGNCPGAFCNPGSITVIDGATNATTTLIDPHASGPGALAIDAAADRIYLANGFSNNLSVIAGDIAPTSHALAVIFSGVSGGRVASSPAGINCGVSSCAASFPAGTIVDLSATGSVPAVFQGWSGACSGGGACQVTMNSDQFVTAGFQILVPNVVGQTQAAASAAITSAGLYVGNLTQGSGHGVAPGNVISESPAAGTVVAAGSAVSLVVSGIVVPNIVGEAQATATAALASAGLRVGNVTQGSVGGVVAGSVISESPAAGAVVASGSTVNVVVSDDVAVPNLVGTTQSGATSAISGAGLIMGTVTQQSSSTVAFGDVISESPAAGSYVPPSSTVNLLVSSGNSVVSSGNPGRGGGGAFDWLTMVALLLCLSPRPVRGRVPCP